MAYDFHLYRLSRPVARVEEIDASIVLPIPGDIPALVAELARVAPALRWQDLPTAIVGRLSLEDDTLDFVLERGARPAAEGLRISSHRGVVASCYPVIQAVCEALGWTAVDLHTWKLLGANVIPVGGGKGSG